MTSPLVSIALDVELLTHLQSDIHMYVHFDRSLYDFLWEIVICYMT